MSSGHRVNPMPVDWSNRSFLWKILSVKGEGASLVGSHVISSWSNSAWLGLFEVMY